MKTLLVILFTMSVSSGLVTAAEHVNFKKTVLDSNFRSEGVNLADINRDGKTDIVVGDVWYEAPKWTPHEIRTPRKENRGGYTEAFGVYTDDFNKDGWADVMVMPFHGKSAKWYENPKNSQKKGHWKEREAFRETGNETRSYVDLFGTGEKVFLMGVEGQIAWVPIPDDPNERWPFHAISEKGDVNKGGHPAYKFAHGLGIGDLNGDGRNDVMYNGGWYEQPESGAKHTKPWKFHKIQILKDQCAEMYLFDGNLDGQMDILATSAHKSGIYYIEVGKKGDELTFTSHLLEKKIHETHALNYLDMNGDGKKDLVTGRRFCAHGYHPKRNMEAAELYWYEIDAVKGGIPKLTPHYIDNLSGIGAQFVTEDVNKDGLIDVITSGRKGVYLFTHVKGDKPQTEPVTSVPLDLFTVPEGMEVSVWATSPHLYNPTNMDIDDKGRVWVTEGVNYRRYNKRRPEGDRIMVLTDTNNDGKADKSHVFVQEVGLKAPLGISVIGNQIIVSMSPDLIVYTDVDGNAVYDPAVDKREVLLTGFGGANHDHSLHSVTAGPSGQWYFNHGNEGSNVTDKDGWNLRAANGGPPSSDGRLYLGGVALRMNPDGTGMRVIGHNFRNSYEQTVTSYGDVFQNDNDDPPAARTAWLMEYGNAGYRSPDGRRSWYHDMRKGQSKAIAEWRQEDPGSMPAGDVYGGGAPTGIAFYESGALGEKFPPGLLLSCEPTRNVVFGYYPVPDGAGFKLERFDFVTTNTEQDFVGADFRRGKMGRVNTLFRPSDVSVGPDGAIYIADWFDARVGGHDAHDKGSSGTIYRIAPKGAKLKVPTYEYKTSAGQIAALKSPAVNIRNAGFVALKAQGEKAYSAVAALLADDNHYIRARAVWLLSQLGPKGVATVEKLLKHKEPQMRIVAFRALRFIGHNTLKNAAVLAKDSHAGVRREACFALRDTALVDCQSILIDIAKGYDGKDRWYLEAFGTACDGKETEMYGILKKKIGHADSTKWDARFADIAWRLHPQSSIKDLKKRALSTAVAEGDRKKTLVALGVQKERAAAYAMADVAKHAEPGLIKDKANEWIKKRGRDLWKSYDVPAYLSGKPTPKVVYQDALVPAALGAPVKLPSVADIFKLQGDAAAGKTAIGQCTMCHRVGAAGVEFGPTFASGWGQGRTLDVIIGAIVNPSADLAHGFAAEEIKTTSGKTLQGFVSAEGDPVVIRVFGNVEVAIDAADIASRKKLKESVMIPASKMGITAQNIRDIAEFLKTN